MPLKIEIRAFMKKTKFLKERFRDFFKVKYFYNAHYGTSSYKEIWRGDGAFEGIKRRRHAFSIFLP